MQSVLYLIMSAAKVLGSLPKNLKEEKSKIDISEARYRRLFETAQDGILLVDFKTGIILDANQFLIDLLGYSKKDFLKKFLWDVGIFKDIAASKENFKTLQTKKYVRFEDLPLETKSGKKIDVEFVANAYAVDGSTTIQCNIRDISERKIAEELLHRNKVYLQTILDSTTDGILAIDKDNKVIRANKQFIKFWKIPAILMKQGSDKKLLTYVLKQLSDPASFIKKVKELYGSKEIDLDTIYFKDGRIFERYSTPLLIDNKIEGRLWSFRDVTKQKETQEKILQEKELTDTIIDSIPGTFYMLDDKGVYVRWNKYQRDQIVGKDEIQTAKTNAIVTIHPDDRALIGAKIANVLKGKDEIVESRVLMRGGPEFKWLLMTGHRIVINNKSYLVGTGIDITERKKVELEIRKFSQAVENASESIAFTDLKGCIVYINASFTRIVGFQKQDINKIKLSDLVAEPSDAKNIFNSVVKSGMWRGELLVLKKDGTSFPSILSVSTIKNAKGEVLGTMGTLRDITHEKEIDKMKTEFVSLTSHQLRTPLTSIKWNLEMIMDGSTGQLNKNQEERLKDVFQSNESMIELVNSFLNISRMESGRLKIEPKLTDLALLFRSVVTKLEPQIKKANLKLNDKISGGLPKISIDPLLISNVYSNLMNNSIKYTPSGGSIEIDIVKDGDSLVSSVKDSGIGIPVAEQKHIFERFFKGSNVTKTTIGSTGLGLYLAKEILEVSGGKIWFESMEGRESTFYFSLPLKGSPAKIGEITLS